MIASSPAQLGEKSTQKTIASTKIYCEMLSCTLLKNQRPIRGNPNRTKSVKAVIDSPNRTQNMSSAYPSRARRDRQHQQRERIGNHRSAHVMQTALFLLIPSLLIMG